ncbi:hypothetical protein E2I00_019974, partial [Balaenoptera physalus]
QRTPTEMSSVLHFYVRPSGHERAASEYTQRKLRGELPELQGVKTELCYNVNWTAESSPSAEEMKKLTWLFGCPLLLDDVAPESWLLPGSTDLLLEVGPRQAELLHASIQQHRAAGLGAVDRVEPTRRYLLSFAHPPSAELEAVALATLHDRMTEQHFPCPIQSFSLGCIPAPLGGPIDILTEGRSALEKANQELGLALDSWDLDFYTKRFQELQRNPSTVEAFDLAQSNSTQASSHPNNVLKFCDNSRSQEGSETQNGCVHSAIQGKEVRFLRPEDPSRPSCFRQRQGLRHVVFTAETHNFPTGVAPFSGATTGTGGRIRDVQCTGRGAHVVAGTAGYCFGNLHIPGYSMPWEDPSFQYPGNFARPLEIAIEASNGASDYGNKFGEPVLAGFARSLGLQLPDGQRREWIKPIMFSGGIGSMEAEHVSKEPPEPGMDVVKVGGPVYRIGVGGGAASSRGDPEMEQKMNRVIRACVEAPGGNPICSLHDQGAGGNGNVLKELSDPAGAVIYTSRFQLGDPTLNALEIWGAEYQESNALLLRPPDRDFLSRVSARERCPACFVGTITGDRRIVLVDDRECPMGRDGQGDAPPTPPPTPVDLDLDWVLGKMPRKGEPGLPRPWPCPLASCQLHLVPQVDRSVGGLVAQQQCDVKCSGNWMWAAKLQGEGAALADACGAVAAVMAALGVAVDGGKDSLSMAARVGAETVRAPGELWAPKGDGQNLVRAFGITQGLLKEVGRGLQVWVPRLLSILFLPPDRLLCSGHDVSDGGLITCLLEMAFAGNCGIEVAVPASGVNALPVLFAEEPGLVLEVRVSVNGAVVLEEPVGQLRALWEETSFQLDRLQAEPHCGPAPRVAIFREEGSNGDREMADAFHLAGFELCKGGRSWASVMGHAGMERRRSPLIPVLTPASCSLLGWAAAVTFNPQAGAELRRFRQRPDTFSLGVCNGCQLLALLGWVGGSYMAFSSPELQAQIEARGLAPLHWADDDGNPTEQYPLNPNGSPGGMAGLFINARNWTREGGC